MLEFNHNQTALEFASDLSEATPCVFGELNSASLLDLNGDSYADVWMQRPADGGSARLLPEAPANLVLKRRFSAQLQLLDINGDARTDLVYACEWQFFPSLASCPSGALNVLGKQNPDAYLTLAIDLGGDGGTELVRYRANAAHSFPTTCARRIRPSRAVLKNKQPGRVIRSKTIF